eukprot:tig00020904_g15265.t1
MSSGERKRKEPPRAAAARAVCGRWREVAETILWRSLDVEVQSVKGADLLCGQLVGAGDGRRWILVVPGSSLRLRGAQVASAVISSVLSACTAASGGLGEVDVECNVYANLAGLRIGELLGALVPRGAAECPALRSLSLRSRSSYARGENSFFATAADDLADLLRPFSRLERLVLPACCAADRDSAYALARGVPRLKRLEIAQRNAEAARGLASFPRLESLCLRSPDDGPALPLIGGLASGPLASALKELRIDYSLCLTPDDLRALPGLSALQALRGPFRLDSDVGGEDLAPLGSCPALRSLGPLDAYPQAWWGSDRHLAGLLSGLAAALAASPALVDVSLRFSLPVPPLALASFAELAGAALGRLSLEMEVDLAPGRPAEVAAALAEAPPRRLALTAGVDEGALRDGRLDGLSAFAGRCPQDDLKVRLRLGRGVAPEAARAAAARVLPSARLQLAIAVQDVHA